MKTSKFCQKKFRYLFRDAVLLKITLTMAFHAAFPRTFVWFISRHLFVCHACIKRRTKSFRYGDESFFFSGMISQPLSTLMRKFILCDFLCGKKKKVLRKIQCLCYRNNLFIEAVICITEFINEPGHFMRQCEFISMKLITRRKFSHLFKVKWKRLGNGGWRDESFVQCLNPYRQYFFSRES